MQKKKVLPGEVLSTEEEFEPGKNAFVEEGNVYSSAVGHPEVNEKQKSIDVNPEKPLKPLKEGSIVFAVVSLVKESSVNVSILQSPEKENRTVISQRHAMLPIRNVSREYVENLRDNFRIGDLIKAKIARTSPLGTDLTTSEPELGVIKAFCTKCRHPLHLFGGALKCLSCGQTERRKISKDYSLK